MIITVGNIKGEVGKTTLTVNLAIHAGKICCKSIVLIDADEQGTATLFTEIKELEPTNYTCVSARPRRRSARRLSCRTGDRWRQVRPRPGRTP